MVLMVKYNEPEALDIVSVAWDILQKDFQENQRVDIWLNNGTYKAKGAWLDDTYKYRVPIRVNAAGYERLDKSILIDSL
ncbi:hypothetical protein ES703_112886 [subsurface metagenome]